MSYKQVSEALDRGVQPEEICSTCPWDRICIKPPTMTRKEVEAKTTPVEDADMNKTLIDILIFAGKDTTAEVCPVLAVRLRSADGKGIVDEVRRMMVATAVEVSP